MSAEKDEVILQTREFELRLVEVDGEISSFSSTEHFQLQSKHSSLVGEIATIENAVDAEVQLQQNLYTLLTKGRQDIRRGISSIADINQLEGKIIPKCDRAKQYLWSSLWFTRYYVLSFTAQHEDAQRKLADLEITVDTKKHELVELSALMDKVAPLTIEKRFIELSAEKQALNSSLKALQGRMTDLSIEQDAINHFASKLQKFIAEQIPVGNLTLERFKDANNYLG